jgi:hypothetical protein
MNNIDTRGQELADRLSAMATRVKVEDRLDEAKGELRYATVTSINRSRRIPMLASIATLAAASVAVVAIQRPDPTESQSRPPAAGVDPVNTQASGRTPGVLVDVFPVIDESDIPIEGLSLYANFSTRGNEQESVTQTFVAGVNDALPRFTNTPTDVISITALRNADPSTIFPEAKPGRRQDVAELTWSADGETTLIWGVDDVAFTMVGSNLDLMYQLIDLTTPVYPQADIAFLVEEPLPGGLVALNSQARGKPGLFPMVSSDGGEVSIEMLDEPALQLFAGQPIERLRVGEYDAWLIETSERAPVLAVEITTRQTMTVFGQSLTREQLLTVAGKIQFADEATWRSRYNVTDFLDSPSSDPDVISDVVTEATEYRDTDVTIDAQYVATSIAAAP